jgi:hypothetical protein
MTDALMRPALDGVPLEVLAFMSPTATTPATVMEQMAIAFRQVSDRIPRLRGQGGRISEQDTKRILIDPAIGALGWDLFDIDAVRNEYRHNAADNPVDYALLLNRSPVLFVEAKPLGHTLDDRKWIVQTINYANAAGVDWCVLTNGAEWRIYKVHAQVDAEQKLFAAVTIDRTEELGDAIRVLRLLSRDNMRARAIDELWQAWHVDRKVQAALEQTLQDEAFANLIRRHVSQLGLADIRKSLRRASISVSYPNIFRDRPTVPSDASASASSAPEPTIPTADTAPVITQTSETAYTISKPPIVRRRFQSTQDLIELGRLKVGDTLTIRGRRDSSARVLDGRHVEFRGERITFNDWGQRVTGWSAIQVYAWACLPDGRTLNDLRDHGGK